MVTSTDTGKKDKNGKAIISKSMTPGAVEKIDSHTVRLNLNRAELAVPENCYNYPTAIVHRRFDDEGGNLSKNPVGTGPYTLKEHVVGEKATLVKRNPADYWGEEVNLDQIRYFDHGDDPAAGLAALASSQVDLVYETFVEQIDVVGKVPNLQLYETVTAQTGVARMQMDSAPFDDVRIRTAVRLCQDHERLLELAYRGKGAPAQDHHVAPIHPEYAKMPTPKQDYAKAKQLLKEAGHANGIDIKMDVKKEPPWGGRGRPDPGRDVQARGHQHPDQRHAQQSVLGDLGQNAVRLHGLDPPAARRDGAQPRVSFRRAMERVAPQ